MLNLRWLNWSGLTSLILVLALGGCGTNKPPAMQSDLWSAAESGNVKDVTRLLAASSDPNAKDKDGLTLLHHAARGGSRDVAELLIAKGADVNARDKDGDIPLLYAAQRELDTLNSTTDKDDVTLLHQAARSYKEMAELLIAQGADVNARGRLGVTPLFGAALMGHREVAELLIVKGADINAKVMEDGWTPLIAALFSSYPIRLLDSGKKDVAELLIAKGADVNARFNVDVYHNITALHVAGNKEIAELLISKGLDVNATTDEGLTPLHGVIICFNHEMTNYSNAKEVIEVLLAQGADINAKAKDGSTPLHAVAVMGHRDVAELLIANGANINARDKDGWTPLRAALFPPTRSYSIILPDRGKNDVVELLITKGAEINAEDKEGRTPLHSAASMGYKDVTELLIANGANINARDKDGWTPLDRAFITDRTEVVVSLIAKGASNVTKGKTIRVADIPREFKGQFKWRNGTEPFTLILKIDKIEKKDGAFRFSGSHLYMPGGTRMKIEGTIDGNTRRITIRESDSSRADAITDGSFEGMISRNLKIIEATWTTTSTGSKGMHSLPIYDKGDLRLQAGRVK